MSRFAEASARAGRSLQADESLRRWESDHEAAETLLAGQPEARPPASPTLNDTVARFRPGRELTAAVSRIFLTPPEPVRSVLFCTVPGEPASAFAFRSAEILALKWGRRVGFLGDGAAGLAPELPDAARGLVTIPACAHAGGLTDGADWSETNQRVPFTGQLEDVACTACVNDLLRTLDIVIVNATERPAEALVAVGRHVDGVVVLVTQNLTRRASARAFVAALRRSQVNLLGVILTNRS